MKVLNERCRRCGGTLYVDDDSVVKCFSCSRETELTAYVDMMWPVPRTVSKMATSGVSASTATTAETGDQF